MAKCKFCKKIIDKNTAYAVEHGKAHDYYCSKEEYESMLKEQLKEADFLEEINFAFDVNINIYSNSCWLDIKQAINTLRKTYTREEILWYINNTLEDAVRVIEKKTFDTEFHKIRYLIAILKNNIAEYLRDHPVPAPAESKVEVDYYMAPVKYKPSNQRRALALIELEELEGDSDE